MINDGLDLKMWNLTLEIIDTHRCFLPADSFQNLIKFHLIELFCLYLTQYFIPLTSRSSKSLVIRHVIPFLYSFCRLLETWFISINIRTQNIFKFSNQNFQTFEFLSTLGKGRLSAQMT